jgi:hypothetical protein
MRTLIRVATFAAAVAAGAALVAPAGIASADSAIETIGLLEAQGYTVNVDRIGNAPLEDCVVVSVRNPQTVTKLVRVQRNGRHGHHDDNGGGRDDFDLVEVVVSRSISVSLNCAV